MTDVLASFTSRAASHLIDVVAIPVAVLVVTIALVRTRHPLAAATVFLFGAVVFVLFLLWNSGYRQGRTGQSLGRRAQGTRLVGAATGRPIGVGRAVVRLVAHLLDLLPFGVGYLWPLWDEQRQTFADKVCSTVVVVADRSSGGTMRVEGCGTPGGR
jgi:uncharacterized RDD family membrane protein YckC